MKNDMVRDLLPPPTTSEETYPYFELGRPKDHQWTDIFAKEKRGYLGE